MFEKKDKSKEPEKEQVKEELEETQPNLEGLEISDDTEEIEFNNQELIPEKIEELPQIPHPALMHYNYLVELESRILVLEQNQNLIIEYLTPKKEEEAKKEG